MQILGFFFAGVVLNQFGLIRNLTDVKILSEWGILFLVRFICSAFMFLFLLCMLHFGFRNPASDNNETRRQHVIRLFKA